MKSIILQELLSAQEILNDFISTPEQHYNIEKAAILMIESLKNGGKIIICGNGGSMSDAMHFAAELTGRYRETRQPIAAIAISDPSYITCVSNDFGYNLSFKRSFTALARQGDVLVCLSTSGKSENVNVVAEYAKSKGYPVIALSGRGGGELYQYCDVMIEAPPHAQWADRTQEIGLIVIHILCHLIEKGMGYGQ